MFLKSFIVLIIFVLAGLLNLQAIAETGNGENSTQAQLSAHHTESSSLNILILDLRDVKNLIQEGDTKTAIALLKSAGKEVRKVTEFNSKTKKTTSKNIKKDIQFLKQNKNDEALALVQAGIDELVEAGLADPSDFE